MAPRSLSSSQPSSLSAPLHFLLTNRCMDPIPEYATALRRVAVDVTFSLKIVDEEDSTVLKKALEQIKKARTRSDASEMNQSIADDVVIEVSQQEFFSPECNHTLLDCVGSWV